ncbi:hypothetical protein [Pantoea sp. 18069]|uniref:hypothetical protein n=1 Tax=Pantoea sp. 18069 TaxID=2681415 RepID=UPI0013571E8F|nr:hypothetical protein [Pantoea sp. 18069]
MKKTLIAAALFSVFAAQAQVTGASTNTGIVYVGASTVVGGPHSAGKPGVGVDTAGNIIDLGGIAAYTGNGSQAVSGVTFSKYKLDGYQHVDEGGTVSTNFNWFRIPSVASAGVAREVYFGLATEPATNAQAAFYVGDRTNYAVPTSNTNYATVAYLAAPGFSPTHVLTGNLRYDTAGTLKSETSAGVWSPLTSTTTTALGINTNVNASTGTFTGSSTYGGVTGTAKGEFYGAGTTSAVAGTASGTGYVAAFGGIRN